LAAASIIGVEDSAVLIDPPGKGQNPMRRHTAISFTIVLLASLFYGVVPAKAPAPAWFSASRKSLCVTEGVIDETAGNRLSVNVPKVRAYVNTWTSQAIEARFTYLGPTAGQVPLGSDEIRRQFGLKLRARDGCNLVYAMWRFEPESKIVVSVKSNPSEHTSAECGNRGYRNIKAQKASPAPALHPGETHTLRTEMNGMELAVFVDDTPVWEGNVGAEALSFDGPVGIRSDNARLELDLRVRGYAGVHPNYVMRCKSDAGEPE
jgi:hypothetical protein